MAQVDKAIRLGVRLDASDIKQDSEKIAKSISSVISNYTKDSKSANATLMSLQHQMRKYLEALDKAKAKRDKIASTPVYSDDYKKIEADLEKTNKYIEKTTASLEKMRAKKQEIGQQQIPTAEYQKQIDEVKKLTTEVDNYERKIQKLELQRQQHITYLRMPKMFGGENKDATEAENEETSVALKEQIEALKEKKELSEDLREKAHQEAEELKQVGQAFRTNEEAAKTGEATKAYMNISDAVKETETNLADATKQAEIYNKTLNSEEFRKDNVIAGTDTQEYADASNKVENLENKLAELVNRYNQAKNAIKNVGPMLKNAFSKAKEAVGGVIGKLKELRSHSKGTFSDMAKNAKHSFWKILKYAFGIRSLFILFKRLKATFAEGMKVMGSNFPEIKAQLDSLSASFTQLKLSLATAFQPIFSVALPALNALMSALVSAMNTLANFFATLTGQKYIYKATKANNALADSYGGAGGAAKDAAEDIAEYDKLIVINQDKAGGGGGGGGAGDANAGAFEKVPAEQSKLAQMIKEAWKESDFTDVGTYIGEKLNAGLKSIPWDKIKQTASNLGKDLATLINGFVEVPELGYNIGKTIAEGFNTGLEFFYSFVENFHWDSLGQFIGDGINGALLTFDWTKLGHTIASGINGAVSTVKNLITTVDVEGIATKIGNGISEFLRTLDTKEIAETLHLLITKALTGAIALLKSIDFQEIGVKIGDFLAGLDIPDLLSKLGELALTIMKSLGDAILGLAESHPEIAVAIGGAIAAIMLASGATTAIAGAATSLFAVGGPVALAIMTAIGGWKLGEWISEQLGDLTELDEDLFKKLQEDMGYSNDEMERFLKNVKKLKKEEVVPFLSDVANSMKELTGHTEKADESTEKLDKSMDKTGKTAQKSGKKTVMTYEDIGSTVSETYNTHEEGAKQAQKSTKDLQESLYEMLFSTGKEAQDSSEKTQTAFDKAKTKIGTTVSTATSNWITKWKTAITTTNTTLETSTKTTSNNMLTSIKGVFKDTGLISTVNSLASTITTAMTGSATTSSTGFLTGFNSAFSSANTTANTTADNITTKFGKTGTAVQSSLTTAWNTITKTFNSGKALTDAAGNVQSKFGTVASGIQKSMSDAWKNIVNAFNSNQVNIKVSDTLVNSINGAIDGLRRGFNNALASGFGQVNDLIDKLNNARGAASGFAMGVRLSHIYPQYLAHGAVIPPNREFLAVLGDQKQGMNIETPLATMLEAFNKALDTRGSSNNAPVVLQLNGRDIAKAVWDENEKKYKQVGKYGTKFA